MALTGGARAHDPNMGAKADVVHCSLAPAMLDAGMRPRTGRGGGRRAHVRQLRNIWLRARLVPRNGGNQ
jgi:hypothetical protein